MATLTAMREQLMQVFPERQSALLAEVIYGASRDLVRADDFNELKEIVRDLAVAQRGLAAAQERTEERLDRLVAAQQRTEERVEGLAASVQKLTEAQQETERSIQRLSKQVGGLSDRFGGDLEDAAYIAIHDVLLREWGWRVGELAPEWVTTDKGLEEIDIYGPVQDPARPLDAIWIVGEVKFNLTVREVERFAQKLERLRPYLTGEILPICFCYRARPEVQQAVAEAGFHLVFSYGRLISPTA